VKAVREKSETTGVRFVKPGYKRERKREAVSYKQSGESKETEVTSEGIGESKMEELVPQ